MSLLRSLGIGCYHRLRFIYRLTTFTANHVGAISPFSNIYFTPPLRITPIIRKIISVLIVDDCQQLLSLQALFSLAFRSFPNFGSLSLR